MATEPRAATDTPAAGRMPPGPPAHPLWGHARESGRDRLGFRLEGVRHLALTSVGAWDAMRMAKATRWNPARDWARRS